MTDKYAGTIYNIDFLPKVPNNTENSMFLAISEPDRQGEVSCIRITPEEADSQKSTINLPPQTLNFDAQAHLNKTYYYSTDQLLEERAKIDESFLQLISKKIVLADVERHHQLTEQSKRDQIFIPGKSRINYAGRIYDKNELINLVDASLDFWLTYGKYSKTFERNFADYLGVKYSFLVNSGSSANLLAFMALTSPLLNDRQIKRGDEVITVAAGFPTTVSPIVQYGAIPVFVDVDLGTFNIDVKQLESAISSKTKAVMLAHTLGNPFDLRSVKSFCEKHNLWLIEDNCDALGSKYLAESEWEACNEKTDNTSHITQFTGSFGDISTSSFYPPHHMTMGEGGAVYTDNKLLKKIILSLRDWGRDCWCESGVDNSCNCRFNKQYGTLPFGYDHKYVYSHFGYNLKPTDLQAAIGCAQLEKIPHFSKRRKENFKILYNETNELSDLLQLPIATPKSSPSWFGFLLTLKDNSGYTRNGIVEFLEKNNIQTRNLFAGNIIRHPCFADLTEGIDYRIVGTLTNTDKIMNDSFWIGLYPGMTEEVLIFMADTIKAFFHKS